MTNITVNENESAVLLCQISDMHGVVKWYYNGEKIDKESIEKHWNGRLAFLNELKARKIVIRDAKTTDSGTYECRDSLGQSSTSCIFEVQRKPIKVISPIENVDILTGENVEFTCILSRPVENLQWFHGHVNINDADGETNSDFDFRKRDFTKRIIVDNSFNKKDGTMICRFKMLKCSPPDSGIISLRGEEVTINQAVLDVSDPPIHFVKELSHKTVEMGQENVRLSCEVSDSMAVVFWYKENIPLEEDETSGKYQFENKGTTRELIISKINKSDQATYICKTMENRTTSCDLHVKIPNIEFTEELRNLEVLQGESIKNSVTLNFSAPGLNCKWLFDGEPIDVYFTNNLINTKHEFDTWEIEISGDLIKDTYTGHSLAFEVCEKSQANNLVSVCQIQVKEKPLKWEISLPDSTVREGLDLVLEATLSVPDVDVEWTYNDQPLEELIYYSGNDNFNVDKFQQLTEGKVQKLILKDVSLFFDNAVFSCVTLKRGKKTSCKVRVKPLRVDLLVEMPKFLEIDEGDKLNLEIAYRPSDCPITWLFNDKPIEEGFFYHQELQEFTTGNANVCTISHDFADSRLHTGKFSAVIGNKFDNPFTCNLKVRPPKTKFVEKLPEKLTINDDQEEVILSCKINVQDADCFWTKDGERVIESKRVKITKFGHECRFTILKACEKDSGEYWALALSFNFYFEHFNSQLSYPLHLPDPAVHV